MYYVLICFFVVSRYKFKHETVNQFVGNKKYLKENPVPIKYCMVTVYILPNPKIIFEENFSIFELYSFFLRSEVLYIIKYQE